MLLRAAPPVFPIGIPFSDSHGAGIPWHHLSTTLE
jgi:hypothetical protein